VLGELLATSDLPGGVVNLLTGFRKELVPTFATHTHLRAIAAVVNADERKTLAKTTQARAYLAKGQTALAAGDPVSAANAFRVAMSLTPEDPELDRIAKETQAKADEKSLHGDVDRPGEQRLFDLLGEQPLAADIGKPPILHSVAGGADGHDFDGALRPEIGVGRDQPIAHERSLEQRHRAAARTDAQRTGRHRHFLVVPARRDGSAHGFSSSLPITAPASSNWCAREASAMTSRTICPAGLILLIMPAVWPHASPPSTSPGGAKQVLASARPTREASRSGRSEDLRYLVDNVMFVVGTVSA